MRIDDEGGALSHAYLRVQNAERGAEVALDVGHHGKGQIPEVGMVGPPGVVDEFAIGAPAEYLRVTILKLAIEFTECGDLGWAHEGEILGPEEINLPLIFEVLVA